MAHETSHTPGRAVSDAAGAAAQPLGPVQLFVTPWTAAPGLPVLHQLPEPAQTRVHPVGDAIQPSNPLLPLLLLPSIFSSIRVFSNELAKVLVSAPVYSKEYSGLISFKID